MFGFNQNNPIKTPILLQSEHAECGVVALSIIMRHFGRWVSTESLRVESGVARDGSSADTILQLAHNHGLQAEGYSSDNLDLSEFGYPCIVHWNFNHFVVLEGQSNDEYYLNDPANGRRTVSKADFSAAFTGIVLTFKPTQHFQKQGHASNWFSALRGYLLEVKHYINVIFMPACA